MGYPNGTRGGLFYSHQDKKVFISTNSTFLGLNYMKSFKPKSKIVLEGLLLEKNDAPQLTSFVKSQRQRTIIPNQDPSQLRCSGREIKLPYRYRGEVELVAVDNVIQDPLSYKSTIEDVDKDEWLKAMNLEMDSMYSNSLWKLEDLPKGVKPIGCKWTYKMKRGVDEKVEIFKARLVDKGYT